MSPDIRDGVQGADQVGLLIVSRSMRKGEVLDRTTGRQNEIKIPGRGGLGLILQ